MTAALSKLVQLQASPTTFGGILQWIDDRILSWAASVQGAMTAWVAGILGILITLVIIWYGFRHLLGFVTPTLPEYMRKAVVVAVIIAFTLVASLWWPLLYQFMTAVPESIAAAVIAATGSGQQGYALLDQLFARAMDLVFSLIAAAGYDLAGYIVALILFVGTFLFVGMAFTLLAMSLVMTALLLGVAPLMVASLAFDATKGIFEKWLGLLIQYFFLPILTYSVATLLVVGAQGTLNITGQPSFEAIIPFLIWCAIGFGVMVQLPSVCSSIGSGIAMTGAASLFGLATAAGLKMGGMIGGAAARTADRASGFKDYRDEQAAVRAETIRRKAVDTVNRREDRGQ